MKLHEIEIIDPVTEEVVFTETLPSNEVSARLKEVELAGYSWSDSIAFMVIPEEPAWFA